MRRLVPLLVVVFCYAFAQEEEPEFRFLTPLTVNTMQVAMSNSGEWVGTQCPDFIKLEEYLPPACLRYPATIDATRAYVDETFAAYDNVMPSSELWKEMTPGRVVTRTFVGLEPETRKGVVFLLTLYWNPFDMGPAGTIIGVTELDREE